MRLVTESQCGDCAWFLGEHYGDSEVIFALMELGGSANYNELKEITELSKDGLDQVLERLGRLRRVQRLNPSRDGTYDECNPSLRGGGHVRLFRLLNDRP